MPYRPPVDEYMFLFGNVVRFRDLARFERFEGTGEGECAEILETVGNLASNVLGPLQRSGDRNPARLENGAVRTPPGYAEAYREIAEGGWVGMSAGPEHGGAGLPFSLTNAANEMFNGACMSLGLSILLTQGQIRALEVHATQEIKDLYLPKLNSGEWLGTMNITEPGAGSDVGAIRSLAVAEPDGSYRLTGQKIFISWADADFAGNICHLVLAREPSAAGGTRGLSLFLAPKFIPDHQGNPGKRNNIRLVSLEQKLGLHGSPTATVEFEGAKCWMIGAPGTGMPAMFTMMNLARLGVGCQGVAIAGAALGLAADHAVARKQGMPARAGGSGAIIDHANIRRLLATMQARLFAARAICAYCAYAIDLADASGEEIWRKRAALLTPIAKVFGSEVGIETAAEAVAVHGGMGYIEETGVAQFLRDGLVATIYEGTNGIQAIDLAIRKLGDRGENVHCLLTEILEELAGSRWSSSDLVGSIVQAARDVRETTGWMAAQTDPNIRIAGSTPYLHALALLLGAFFHFRAHAAVGGVGKRAVLASVYVARILPACSWRCQEARAGVGDLFGLADDDLVS